MLVAETTFRQGVSQLYRFLGEDGQGWPVNALVRIRLDSATGPVLK
jgi:hypothetical protein